MSPFRPARSVRSLVRLLALVPLLSVGCISDRGGNDREDAFVPTVGKSSRREVVRQWGNPDAIFGDVWVWRNRRTAGGKLRASFMMIGATVKNLSKFTLEHRLVFGPDGRLASIETVDYTPDRDGWSINPWK